MTLLDQFLWIVIPYMTLTIFVVGHIYRYQKDQFGWSAGSSQFLESRQLKWGSNLFHFGIILVFFGHVAGLLVPEGVYSTIGITKGLYHLGAVWIGGGAGIITLGGIIILAKRRGGNKRIRRGSSASDIVVLTALIFVIVSGFTNTIGYAVTGGDFDYRTTIGPWLRGILTFRPDAALMVGIPRGFQIHVIASFFLFAYWPFSRLVHVWSLPLEYLKRRYIVYRKLNSENVK
nr:respiratory nitrate reductase subunit gamma [Evansella caseinilytica]